MASDVFKRPQVSATPPPPRTINVEKYVEARAPELESLHSIVSDRLNHNFRSQRSKRRRTTAFDDRVSRRRGRKRKARGDSKRDALESSEVPLKTSRRVRRRMELKMNDKEGFSTSGDGTKRLRTHVWHAKRFSMTKLWGFHLPLGLQGRGKGSRALLKWYNNGVLVHDASYFAAVQLEGPQDSLVSILGMVLVSSTSSQCRETSDSVISGAIYESAMLRHVGVPECKAIAPVTYMWRPRCSQNGEDVTMVDSAGGCSKSDSTETCSTSRQLWVWLHPSSFSEGFDTLKLACQNEMDKRGITINCFPLVGQLAKIEVMGSKASQLLQKILHPAKSSAGKLWQLKRHSPAEVESFEVSSFLQSEECTFSQGIASLTVKDPRLLHDERISEVEKLSNTNSVSHLSRTEAKEGEKELWDTSWGISPPLDDSFLCKERNLQRMNKFCLDGTSSEIAATLGKVQGQRSCPILLLKDNHREGSLARWSIVLPLSWIRAFWISLVSKGAHAIGLREKQWIACEVGLPLFPLDFPDCNADSCYMVNKAADSEKKAELRPPAKRPFKIPIPPPWDSIRVTLEEGTDKVEKSQISSELESIANGYSISKSDGGDRNSGHLHNSFDGTIARTASVLTGFLNEIRCDSLLLFPKGRDCKSRLLELVADEAAVERCIEDSSKLANNRKLCFVRVLLHAWKEGVFEEGAVVCAPYPADLSLWISGSSSSEGLKLPDSAVRDYFQESSPGRWELCLPEDSVVRKSHRWPIGFVTSGFVRGSKKPAATGFCDAVMLAHLRGEQWKAVPVNRRRKEIYVLVRNLRSSAYRLALATILLEHQDDVEFM